MQSLSKIVKRTVMQKSLPTQCARAAFSHHNTDPFEGNVYTHAVKARVSKPAPKFEGMSWYKNDFKKISLDDYKGKYVVLFFYPLDFTFVCPTEIKQFNDLAPKFNEANCEVIAASVDSHFTHMEWTKKPRDQGGLGDMQIPMLSDISQKIARDYGCQHPDTGFTFRATYIIDDKGVLKHISINDTPVGRNAEEYLRLVKAF